MRVLRKGLLLLMVLCSSIVLLACINTVSDTTYKVEFLNTDLADIEVLKGGKVQKPTTPIKTDHSFDDWYADEAFDTLFDFNTPIESDTKIYASFYISIPAVLNAGASLSHNEVSDTQYYVMGTIKSIVQIDYGNLTITDGVNDIFVYGVYSKDGATKYGDLTNKPVVGDIVYLKGPLKKFNESIELNNTRLIKMKQGEKPDFDITDYQELSIDEARGTPSGTKVLIEGVVANITFAGGMRPCGVYLVDDSNSIYVYDGDLAASVSVGDAIKIAVTRDNFILESEIPNAIIHGYQGALQVIDAHLIEKDSGDYAYDKDWIQTKSMKEIMEIDYTQENITGVIFKTKVFIKKAPGNGFTNYYFNDLDNQTGSYAYSMNNGSDFTWLDQYDGQLRWVYLSVINAKANPAGILYRLQPIEIGEVFEYDQSYNPELAVVYFGVGQFATNYVAGSSPDLSVITNVDAPWLGISGVTLSYTSSNESTAYFELVDDELIFKTLNEGVALITIKGSYQTYEFTQVIQIGVYSQDEPDSISIAQAIQAPDETEVTIKGVVAASLINQPGVFIIDDTGVVAVRMAASELTNLSLGNEVVITGTKTHIRGSNDPSVSLGQLVIDQAVVAVNYLGKHDYNDSFFIRDKRLSDVIGLNKLEEHSTTVYVIEVEIVFTDTPYYSRYDLKDGASSIHIYSSNASQVSFLQPYVGQTVLIEYIPVNWNGNNYAGGVISVIVNGEKIPSNQHFK